MAASQELNEQIRAWFQEDPSRMTMMAARKFSIPEEQAVQALVGQWPITPLRMAAFKGIMQALNEIGLVRVFVRNRAAVIEVSGWFGEFSEGGGFFNVQSETIDMHILPKEIAAIYAVEKPSHDVPEQHTYSVQFFDKTGEAAFKVFLWENFPSIPSTSVEKFRLMTQQFAR